MDKFFSIVRGFGLKRGPQRWLGGVCGGIAAKLNVDVAFVRIAFLLLSLLPGPAFVFYLAAWLILPDQRNAIILAVIPRQTVNQRILTVLVPQAPAPRSGGLSSAMKRGRL